MRMPSPRAGKGLARLLTVAAGAACTNERLASEWEETVAQVEDDPLYVVDWFPADGIPGVPDDIRPYYFFNRPLEPGESPELALSVAGLQVEADAQADFDDVGVRFTPPQEIPDGLGSLSLAVGDEVQSESTFSTDFGSGTLLNMSIDLRCERFGSDPAHADLLSTFFDPGVYPLWILQAAGLKEDTPLPATIDLHFGPGYVRDSGALRIYREFGFSGRFEGVEVRADGGFRATRDGVFLPLDSPEEVIVLYLDQPVLTGRFDFTGSRARVVDAWLEGVFTLRWLRKLADASSSYRAAVDVAQLDVDANGNGVDDSATFAVSSQPEEIFPSEYDD